MKSIISGAVFATAIVACLSLNVRAKPLNHAITTTAVSDTGKMAKDKMKMAKKDDKMAKDKMKMDKKMEKKKMAKDTAKGKM
jgi:hypothetical protein